MKKARVVVTTRAFSANAGGYWCGDAFSTWLLQYFLISLFESLGLLAFCASSQSFICCLCDFVLVVVLDGRVVVVEVLLLGYVERSDGGVRGGLVCATTIPAAMSAARAKDAANRFIVLLRSVCRNGRAWTRVRRERISPKPCVAVGGSRRRVPVSGRPVRTVARQLKAR